MRHFQKIWPEWNIPREIIIIFIPEAMWDREWRRESDRLRIF